MSCGSDAQENVIRYVLVFDTPELVFTVNLFTWITPWSASSFVNVSSVIDWRHLSLSLTMPLLLFSDRWGETLQGVPANAFSLRRFKAWLLSAQCTRMSPFIRRLTALTSPAIPWMIFAVMNGFAVNCFSPSGWMSKYSGQLLTGIREEYPVNVSSSDDCEDSLWCPRLCLFLEAMVEIGSSAPPLLTRHGVPTRAMPCLRMSSRLALRLWGCYTPVDTDIGSKIDSRGKCLRGCYRHTPLNPLNLEANITRLTHKPA